MNEKFFVDVLLGGWFVFLVLLTIICLLFSLSFALFFFWNSEERKARKAEKEYKKRNMWLRNMWLYKKEKE